MFMHMQFYQVNLVLHSTYLV